MKHGLVHVWRLTPEQIAAYRPGMDLGKPDRIEEPPRPDLRLFIIEGQKERQQRGVESRLKGKELLSEELYKEHAEAGMSDKEIVDEYGLKLSSVKGYKSLWRRKGREKEE